MNRVQNKKNDRSERNAKIKKNLYIIKNSKYGNEIKDAIINIVCLLTNIDPESISVLNE